jgi:hypothetical protein
MDLVPVGDDATTAAARHLVGEYLSWVAGVAAEHHGLVFDTDAMLAFDGGDRSEFYAPHGRFYLVRSALAYVGVGALQRGRHHRGDPAHVRAAAVARPWCSALAA